MRIYRLIAATIVATILTGCGSSEDVATSREAAAVAVDKGRSAFAGGDFVTAADQLAVAVNSGTLNPDAYCEASVKLAVAYAATGKFEDAYAVLDSLEGGAPNLDEVWAARSYALKKQGKAAESRAALAKARQYNRQVKEFK